MAELARAGVVINVSPVRDDGPQAARRRGSDPAQHHTAMLLALTTRSSRKDCTTKSFGALAGFERQRPYLMGAADGSRRTPTGPPRHRGPAETIRRWRAHGGERTMISASWSLQRADHGEQVYWAVILWRPRWVRSACRAEASVSVMARRPASPMRRSRSGRPGWRSVQPLGRAIPVARISDCLLNPGAPYDFNGKRGNYPDIKLVYWAGGNPFHHHQDTNKLRRAWQRPETIIVHEPWWTATARHADVVLPATTTLERNDIGAAHRGAHVVAMQQAIAPVGEALSDYAIFSALARAWTAKRPTPKARGWSGCVISRRWRDRLRTNAAIPDFDGFWSASSFELPRRADDYVMLAEFRTDPQSKRLTTPSGRIELYSERIAGFGYDDCPPHATWLEPTEWLGAVGPYPLHLVSSQPRERLHSQMAMGPVSARAKVAGRETIAINPVDARSRGIAEGDVVRLFNARGSCLAGAVVTDVVAPGVVRPLRRLVRSD
jgi:biotin/methionine sulfoxide reductase